MTILAALPIMTAAESSGVPVDVDAMAKWFDAGHVQVMVQTQFGTG